MTKQKKKQKAKHVPETSFDHQSMENINESYFTKATPSPGFRPHSSTVTTVGSSGGRNLGDNTDIITQQQQQQTQQQMQRTPPPPLAAVGSENRDSIRLNTINSNTQQSLQQQSQNNSNTSNLHTQNDDINSISSMSHGNPATQHLQHMNSLSNPDKENMEPISTKDDSPGIFKWFRNTKETSFVTWVFFLNLCEFVCVCVFVTMETTHTKISYTQIYA